jgi:hypothetical protein
MPDGASCGRGQRMPMTRWPAIVAIAALAAAGAGGAGAETLRIRGVVVEMNGAALDVRTDAGQVVGVRVAQDARITARSAASLSAITPGAFIGTTATPSPDGTLSAVEVHIFPESMRGNGEGHRPMDAPRGSTMTNATVTDVVRAGAPARSSMTNATVTDVAAGAAATRITLKYKDGEQVVVIGSAVPVVTIEPADASMLVPGAHVVVTAGRRPDGVLAADRIVVGRNGLVPP